MAENIDLKNFLASLMTSDLYEKKGWFSCVTPLLQKLSAQNTKSIFPNKFNSNLTTFSWSNLKNSSAIRKSMSTLTKVDTFQILATFFLWD